MNLASYAAIADLLGAAKSRKVGHNTYAERLDADTVAIRLHSTHVVTFTTDGTITFDNGGYASATTKDRMNAYTPSWIQVAQRDFAWYVRIDGVEAPYVNGFTTRTGIEVLAA